MSQASSEQTEDYDEEFDEPVGEPPRVAGAELVAGILTVAAWLVALGGLLGAVGLAFGLRGLPGVAKVAVVGYILSELLVSAVFAALLGGAGVVIRLLSRILEQIWVAAGE